MRRFLFLIPGLVPALAAVALLIIGACSSTSTSFDGSPTTDGGRKDGETVQPLDGGAYDAGNSLGPEPTCSAYCTLVMDACSGALAQYASRDDCLGLCAHLPQGDAGDTDSNTVACRQYYAGSPARTNAASYCFAAGPFGGGVCGDRCPIFCGLAVGACSADAGSMVAPPFSSYPDCQTACLGFAYKDIDAGGGEPANGPTTGDTLNCRLFHLRGAVHDSTDCANLGVDSGACR